MVNEAQFNLGARTNFVVEEYFLKEQGSNAAVRLLSGAVGIVTGKIASLSGRPFELKTATATIGVRGTTFWGGDGPLSSPEVKAATPNWFYLGPDARRLASNRPGTNNRERLL
jgi:hypothetical protein